MTSMARQTGHATDDKPFVRTLTVRYFAGCYDETDVPEDLSRGKAIRWAQGFLRDRWKGRFKGCLALSPTECVWFEESGGYRITADLPSPSMSERRGS